MERDTLAACRSSRFTARCTGCHRVVHLDEQEYLDLAFDVGVAVSCWSCEHEQADPQCEAA